MDLAIEANRNSALFNTMQQVLDVYNPLLHKARPTVVNETKHRIRVNPTRWGNTFDAWNGRRTARFDLPRIGSLVDATVKVAFRFPGEEPSAAERQRTGDRGFAKPTLATGGLNNTDSTSNTARGRLDRIYADRLLGFNMISMYTVSSKSRQIFRGTGEYLLTRFSQMDTDMKDAVFDSVTPVDVMAGATDDMYYSPATTYQMTIPLFMFFNEHITNALDVNFSEEVHIDIEFRAPSELFYYGNLGDLNRARALIADDRVGQFQRRGLKDPANLTDSRGRITWDQSTTEGAVTNNAGTDVPVTIQQVNTTGANAVAGDAKFGTVQVARNLNDDNAFTVANDEPITETGYQGLVRLQQRHIQGLSAPMNAPNSVVPVTDAGPPVKAGYVGANTYYGTAGYTTSSTTFSYPDVDNLGESVQIMFELNADYIVQDTDAYRALRAQMYPEGTGLTTIVYDTAQETFSNLFTSTNPTQNLLDYRSGGNFTDPDQNASGINIGDSTRFVDLQLRVNNLCMATHFMVRKHSDMGGSKATQASKTIPTYGRGIPSANKTLGAHRTYTRALPVHYFQLLAAGRVIYESDGRTQLNLTQSAMYNGTGRDWGTKNSDLESYSGSTQPTDTSRINGRPFNIYTINFGLQASRLENTGCLSYQNLNNPTLRIYFKPDTWAEHQVNKASGVETSEAEQAAALGVQVDVIHEFFNVVTVNSGNGEITSGLNQ